MNNSGINQNEVNQNDFTLSLPEEFVDHIIVTSLKQHMEYLKEDIENIQAMEEPPSYKLEDIKNNRELLHACNVLLEYYGR